LRRSLSARRPALLRAISTCAPSREIGHGLDATRTRQDVSSLAGRRLSQLMSRRWVACLRMLHHCPTSCSTGASARHMIIDAATRTPAVIAWWIARYALVAGISDHRNSRTTRVLTISPPAIWLARKCKSTTSSSDDLKGSLSASGDLAAVVPLVTAASISL
jgi:hypothetical protein